MAAGQSCHRGKLSSNICHTMDSLTQRTEVPEKEQKGLMETAAEYMRKRFLEETREGPRALPDVSLPFAMVCEADHIISVVVAAYRNIVTVGNPPRRCGGGIDASLEFNEITSPAVLVDSEGQILVWYLLGAFSNSNQIAVWESIARLRGPLEQSLKRYKCRGWRNDINYFRQDADLKGAIDLSPAWFQQGRGPPNHCPEVSSLLKGRRGSAGPRGWLTDMAKINALLSGILRIIHPRMHKDGENALRQLAEKAEAEADRDMASALSIWGSVYSSMSVMVNRATPYHTDMNGRQSWLDMLLTVGDYKPLDFVIPSLELRLRYNPGTVVALSGSALEHGVGNADGNRACLAYYMRENVHRSVGISVCDRPNLTHLVE